VKRRLRHTFKPAWWALAHWTILTLEWYKYSCNFLKIAWAYIKHNTLCCIKQNWSKLYCLHEIPFDFIHIVPLRPGVFLSSWSKFLERCKFFNIKSKNWFSIHLWSCSWLPLRRWSWAKCPLQETRDLIWTNYTPRYRDRFHLFQEALKPDWAINLFRSSGSQDRVPPESIALSTTRVARKPACHQHGRTSQVSRQSNYHHSNRSLTHHKSQSTRDENLAGPRHLDLFLQGVHFRANVLVFPLWQQLKYTKLNLFVQLICPYTIAYIPWFYDQNFLR